MGCLRRRPFYHTPRALPSLCIDPKEECGEGDERSFRQPYSRPRNVPLPLGGRGTEMETELPCPCSPCARCKSNQGGAEGTELVKL